MADTVLHLPPSKKGTFRPKMREKTLEQADDPVTFASRTKHNRSRVRTHLPPPSSESSRLYMAVPNVLQSNPAWQPLVWYSPIGFLLLLCCGVGFGLTLWLLAPVPDVVPYVLAQWRDQWMVSSSGLLRPVVAAETTPVLLGFTMIWVLGVAHLYGARVAGTMFAVLWLAQLLGVPLWINMGHMWQLDDSGQKMSLVFGWQGLGPTWLYGLGWVLGAVVSGLLLTGRGKLSQTVKKRRLVKKRATSSVSTKQVASARQAPEAKAGSIIRLKRSEKAPKGAAGAFHKACGGLGHLCRNLAVFSRKAIQFSVKAFNRSRPHMAKPPAALRYVAQVCWASALGIAMAHGIGIMGLLVWMFFHHIPLTQLEHWLTLASSSQWLYEWVLAVSLLVWIRPLRQLFRFVVY